MHREGGLMQVNRRFLLLFTFGVFGMAIARAQEPVQEAIPNWPAPATWSSHTVSRGVPTMGAITSPIPFIGLAPRRIVDTRGNGAPIQGGMYTGRSDVRNYAAVVPTNSSVAFTVNVSALTHLIIDVNGYYAAAGVGTHNTFLGLNAGNFTMTGDNNTGVGYNALFSNTTDDSNTASGVQSLFSNTMGINNTASGDNALADNTTCNDNIALEYTAGSNLTTGSNNICIGNLGVAGESGTIRIGSSQTATFGAGVDGVMTGGTGTPVLIDSSGQLGTISSSARFKDEIQDMGEATEGLLRPRPVTLRYKAQPEGRTQFGLIGEEVEKIMPELREFGNRAKWPKSFFALGGIGNSKMCGMGASPPRPPIFSPSATAKPLTKQSFTGLLCSGDSARAPGTGLPWSPNTRGPRHAPARCSPTGQGLRHP